MLSVEHVTKKFGNFTALEDVSLTFERGVYGLLAPNGAGKTTLIKMLATLLFPTSGTIRWNGEEIVAMGEDYRGILGYLPQEFGYYKNYSPQQFLSYIAALQCMDRKTAKQRINMLLEQVSLSDVKHKKMRQFSGGMLQRVGIAQAMLNDPKLLILDEPTAGLDPKERVRFRNLIHRISNDRIVILSTHIVSDIETIASQIVMIRRHRILGCETPMEICERMRGKLFEVPADTVLKEGELLLSECQGEQGTMLRIVSQTGRQIAGARQAVPNLEDAFLYIYQNGNE
ncbi:MAG: ABC transporter ATP-binding protein [Eubacterium sp.]|nr:ABC transporter ATP-binding protein [Eubacterium sp.]